jgi:DNA-binding XRE family transcriptional regulator
MGVRKKAIRARVRKPARYNLFLARQERGLSSRDMAEILGISHEGYLNIEYGWTKKIDWRIARKLVETFGMSLEELLAGKEYHICENKGLFKRSGLPPGREDGNMELVCIQT